MSTIHYVPASVSFPNIGVLPAGSHDGPDWNRFPGASWDVNSPWIDSTGVYLRRLTNASSFGGNTNCAFEYSTGGPRISQPFGENLNTYWVMFLVSGVVKAMKYTLGVGADVSTIRTVPPGASGSGLSACFSMLSGEEHIIYVSQRAGAFIDRYDVDAEAYAPKTGFTSGTNAAGFAHGGSSDAGWLQSSWDGQYIVFQSPFSSPTKVHYLDVVNATQTVTTSVTGLNEISMLKGTSKVVVFKDGSNDAAWWFVDTNKVTAYAASTRSGHSDAGASNFYSWNADGSYHPLWVQSTGSAPAATGDPWTGTVTARYDNDSQNVAGGGGHPSMAWDQTGSAGEYYCYYVGSPNGHESLTWSVDSGSVYKATPTLNGYQENIVGITSVDLWNGTSGAGSAYTGALTQAASRVAMTAGTWFWSDPTLYIWMADSTTPANKVSPKYNVLTAWSCAYAKADGTGTKRLCFTYHDSHDTTYERTPFANWSPDGKLVVFNSNLGTYSGRADLVAAEVPLAYA